MEETAAERIIWSADVSDENAVMECVDTMPGLRRVKIDRVFRERHGAGVFGALNDRGFEVFYDAKYIEKPSKLEELAKTGVELKPWMLNCVAGSVSNGEMTLKENRDHIDGLRRFSDVCLSAGVLPCGVTVLTSKTTRVVSEEFNRRSVIDQVLYYVEVLIQAQFTDVVCSAEEAGAIYSQFGDWIKTNTPAIRFSEGQAGDQARVTTPAKAIENKASRLVMGQPLTQCDPAVNFARAVAEVEAALAA